jgi:hypothetical protein
MYQNTFGKASTSGVASVPGILPVQLCLVQSLGRLYVPLPFTGWQRSLVYSCATLPDPEPWPVICFTSVNLPQRSFNLGSIPATYGSCSMTGSSFSAGFHDRSKRHMTCWQSLTSLFQFVSQLECYFRFEQQEREERHIQKQEEQEERHAQISRDVLTSYQHDTRSMTYISRSTRPFHFPLNLGYD